MLQRNFYGHIVKCHEYEIINLKLLIDCCEIQTVTDIGWWVLTNPDMKISSDAYTKGSMGGQQPK